MICIIASSYQDAWRWARSQQLHKDEWFYPDSPESMIARTNFHVVITDDASALPSGYFERLLAEAKRRGRIDRKW